VGAAALHQWRAVGYVFGAILIVTAVKLLRTPKDSDGPPRVLGWLKRHLPWTDELHGHHFIALVADPRPGRLVALRRVGTPLLVAVIAIELTDIVFALDSVPAAFAVSDEPFIVYSSNVFAILGLRALYIVLASLLAELRYLHYALAAILAFAGAKLVGAQLGVHIAPLVSVAAIFGALAIAVVFSLRARRRVE
jgi:tellurite resistance protein TerC